MSRIADKNKSYVTDGLKDLGTLKYIPSLTVIDEEDHMIEEYLGHDMLGEFHVF